MRYVLSVFLPLHLRLYLQFLLTDYTAKVSLSLGRLGRHGRPQAATRLLHSTRSPAARRISAPVGGCSCENTLAMYSQYVVRFPPGRRLP